MKPTYAFFVFVLTLFGTAALAQDAARGRWTYNATCAVCHGDPFGNPPQAAANQPSVIRSAIASIGAMQFLRGLLSDSDVADIAAYIGRGVSGSTSDPPPPVSYQGLWLNASESGWGVNIVHQGDILFATWFTYDTDGSGMWLVMSNGASVGAGRFSGDLYRTIGPAFDAVPFSSITFPRNYTRVGSLTLSFTDANNGTMSYTVNGVEQAKPIVRFNFVAHPPTCTLGAGSLPNFVVNDFNGLWLSSPLGTEAGWGVNIVHQGNILFATWFTYLPGSGDANKGLWLVMSDGVLTPDGSGIHFDPLPLIYKGDLQSTMGPPFSAVPFDPNRVTRMTVGSAMFTFANGHPDTGSFSYTVNGITQSKQIARYVYATPATVCR